MASPMVMYSVLVMVIVQALQLLMLHSPICLLLKFVTQVASVPFAMFLEKLLLPLLPLVQLWQIVVFNVPKMSSVVLKSVNE